MTKLVDPDAPVVVELRNGRRHIALPSKEEAAQKVHNLIKKVSDLPAPPDLSNPIAVVLSYELFGLSVEETALAMSVSLQSVNRIKATEHYSQFKQAVLTRLKDTTTDTVTKLFEEKAEGAARRITDLVDSPSGIISLSASKIVLEKARGAQTQDPMKNGLQIVIYNNNSPDHSTVIEHGET
jgi:hypothetical protein